MPKKTTKKKEWHAILFTRIERFCFCTFFFTVLCILVLTYRDGARELNTCCCCRWRIWKYRWSVPPLWREWAHSCFQARLGSVQRAHFHWFTMFDYRAANLRATPTTAGMMTLTAREVARLSALRRRLAGSVGAHKTFHCFSRFIVASLNVI